MPNLLQFKKVWKITPATQIILISILYVATVIQSYLQYKSTGLIYGYPPSISILFVPIYEEIIFRGFILDGFAQKVSKTRAIIFSSILFGLWHLKNIFYLNEAQVIHQILYTALFFGPIMAIITLRTKTIWIGVILHYLNNILVPVWAAILLLLS